LQLAIQVNAIINLYSNPSSHQKKVLQDLLDDITSRLQDDREGHGELQGQESPDQCVEGIAREVRKDIP